MQSFADKSGVVKPPEILASGLNCVSIWDALQTQMSTGMGDVQIGFGGPGRYGVLPLDLREVSFSDFLHQPLKYGDESHLFTRGFVGVLAYDDLLALARGVVPQKPLSRLWWADGALVFSQREQRILLANPTPRRRELAQSLLAGVMPSEASTFSLQAEEPFKCDQDYMDAVESIRAEILRGRYYQLNLLRYFKADLQRSPASVDEGLIARLAKVGGPFSVYLRAGALVIASFSPERFLRLEGVGGCLVATAEPIKGTMARVADPAMDSLQQQALAASQKDACELNMIVDLLRNDLNRIAEVGSVEVMDQGSVRSFEHVHHRVAMIIATLRRGLTVRDVLQALCPGGSITGAPKLEVMTAIEEWERRSRGFFMGHAVLWDPAGYMDTSILIRTLVSEDGGKSFEFAAGSGIVLASEPKAEAAEITAKCRVVTATV